MLIACNSRHLCQQKIPHLQFLRSYFFKVNALKKNVADGDVVKNKEKILARTFELQKNKCTSPDPS